MRSGKRPIFINEKEVKMFEEMFEDMTREEAKNKLLSLRMNTAFLRGQLMPQETILSWFDLLDAYWVHDGDPQRPHAELASGNCSNGFINCLEVLQRPALNGILAWQLALQLSSYNLFGGIDCVIGSPMAGITFSYEVAKCLNAKRSLFAEKDPKDPKKFIFRFDIKAGEKVLQVEELITTAHTLNGVKEAVEKRNGPVNWVPCIATLVHRPPKLPHVHYENRRVVALIEKEIWSVSPEECHLCKAGSERLKPKIGNNWSKLTGRE